MGKKNLLKSTSKKKRVSKKGNKISGKSKGKPQKKVVNKQPTYKEILLKKFDTKFLGQLFVVESNEDYLNNFSAPPFFDDENSDVAKTVKKLIKRSYIMTEAEKAAAEKAAAEKAAAEKAAAEKVAAEKAAAEKAAAEKAAAEKAAAEKVAAEKAAAEKAAAEKAAAEKAAAEKAAAEKAAAEKAAAEKAAAEKAAAEKAAAEKAAAEKAAAEKVAAEKAAAEKVAAEKAAAEKAAAEKAAAEKAAAEIKLPSAQSINACENEFAEKTSGMKNIFIIAICAVAVLFAGITITSRDNSKKFFIKSRHGAVEIWKGKFSPTGKKFIAGFPKLEAPENIKPVYTETEVYTIAFDHNIKLADSLLNEGHVPDFEKVKAQLNKAKTFAITKTQQDLINFRINGIDKMFMIYKADILSISDNTDDLKKAVEYLKNAKQLCLKKSQSGQIDEKIKDIQKRIPVADIKKALKKVEK